MSGGPAGEPFLPSNPVCEESSLLDLVDHLLDKGCVLNGSLLLGLADIDLIRIDLSLVIGAADRMLSEGASIPPVGEDAG